MNAAVIDIETTNLAAVGAGIVIVVCIRPTATQRTRVFRLDQYDLKPSDEFGIVEREETKMLQEVNDEIRKYYFLIGHNIRKFDVPYLRSRAFQRQVAWTARPVMYDTLHAFRRTGYLTQPNGFGKPSAGLDMVADFGKVIQEKTRIYPNEWWETIWGNKRKRVEAMDKIVDHCQRDVRLNANVLPFLWEADVRPVFARSL